MPPAGRTGRDHDPCVRTGSDPCACKRRDPCADKGRDPCADKGRDPCADNGRDPCADKGRDPCADKGRDPCADKERDPCAGTGQSICSLPLQLTRGFNDCQPGTWVAAWPSTGGQGLLEQRQQPGEPVAKPTARFMSFVWICGVLRPDARCLVCAAVEAVSRRPQGGIGETPPYLRPS